MSCDISHALDGPDILLRLAHFGVVLQRDNETVPEGRSLQPRKEVHVLLLFHKALQRLLPGDKLGAVDIGNQVDLRADALGLGLGIGVVNIDQHFIFLLQLHDHLVEVEEDQAEGAHNDQAGHRYPDSGEGHEAVEEDAADALPQEIADVILLHTRNTHPFRR